MDEGRILLRDRVDGLDSRDEVVEAASSEDDGERRLLLLGRVDRDEPLRKRALRACEVPASDAQCLPVDPELVLDVLQCPARRLIPAVRPLRRRIEPLQLHEHGLRLGALGADLVRVRSRCGRTDEAGCEQPDEQRRDRCLPPRHAQ